MTGIMNLAQLKKKTESALLTNKLDEIVALMKGADITPEQVKEHYSVYTSNADKHMKVRKQVSIIKKRKASSALAHKAKAESKRRLLSLSNEEAE